MNFFPKPPPRDILIEQTKDALEIIKIRVIVFPVFLVLFMTKKVTFLFSSNLIFLFFGYSQFLLKDAKNYIIKETKCVFSGDPYHEFLVTWE